MNLPFRIYLVGYMGSGKSTAGRKLATMLGWQFLDLDEMIEAKYASTIEKIFLLSGESTFRTYEKELLQNLEISTDSVISVGGGAPCFYGNMEYMKKTGLVIYLKMTPLQLKTRLLADTKQRPLLKGLSEDELGKFIEMKLAEREVFYLQSTLIIDGSDPDLENVRSKIARFRGEK
jgi:shikimate kinase